MKKYLGIVILLTMAATSLKAELIKNGDVNNMTDWNFRVAPHYLKNATHEPVASYPDGHIRIEKMGSYHVYAPDLVIYQAIDIVKGKKYKVSLEAKAPGSDSEGMFRVSIGAHFMAWDVNYMKWKNNHFGKNFQPTTEWQTFQAQFTGKFAPEDIPDLKKELEGYLKENGKDVKQPKKASKTDFDPKLMGLKITGSTIFIGMGQCYGDIELRNISVVEVVE